jgi:bifunctional oligoribonuclease and PAP phosphatase NrnA
LAHIDSIKCRQVREKLFQEVKRLVIIPHANPDGDAVGSSLGLSRLLQNAGFETIVIFPTQYPENLRWLGKDVKTMIYEFHEKEVHKIINRADLLFFLDFNDIKRIGKLQKFIEKVKKPIVLIDHHPDPSIAVDYLFSEIKVSSTAELVTEFIEASDLTMYMDQMSANALLTGIIADTGSFNHNSSRPQLYETVGKLISLGAEKEKIQDALYNNFTEKRMRLLGYCLSEKMEVFPEFHSAMIWLTKEELKQFDFQNGDTEGIVNYPLSIKGIIFTAMFIEKDDLVKISLRSKGGFPANEFSATHFSGGGHKNAAGGESKLKIDEVINQFRELLPEYSGLLESESLLPE